MPVKKDATDTVSNLKEHCAAMLLAAEAQCALRKAITDKQTHMGLDENQLAVVIRIKRTYLAAYLEGRPATDGHMLHALTEFAEQPDTETQIRELIGAMRGSEQALCRFDEPTIKAVYNIQICRASHGTIPREIFLSVFGEDATHIKHVLEWNSKGCEWLTDPKTRQNILRMLSDGEFENRLDARLNTIKERGQYLGSLLEEIGFESRESALDALGQTIHVNTLTQAITCSTYVSLELQETLITRAEQILRDRARAHTKERAPNSPKPTVAVVANTETPQTKVAPRVVTLPLNWENAIGGILVTLQGQTELLRYFMEAGAWLEPNQKRGVGDLVIRLLSLCNVQAKDLEDDFVEDLDPTDPTVQRLREALGSIKKGKK